MKFNLYRSKYILIISLVCIYTKCFAEQRGHVLPCLEQPKKQADRAKELKELLDADQKERANFENMTEKERITLSKSDLLRRKRVGKILGEGCFKTSEDYLAASLIYQHGDSPDHYFQAFIWAVRAVQLGNKKRTGLVAVTIDRYLLSIGKKQLFGSQAFASKGTGWCYCLQPVEPSFPDEFRKKYSGLSLQERVKEITSVNEGKNCSDIRCDTLEPKVPSPRGTVPGFW